MLPILHHVLAVTYPSLSYVDNDIHILPNSSQSISQVFDKSLSPPVIYDKIIYPSSMPPNLSLTLPYLWFLMLLYLKILLE